MRNPARKRTEMQFNGKKGLILGVANDHSIAWAIAKQIMDAGGECGFTHLPDRPDDERQRNRRRVSNLTDKYENAKFLLPMDAQDDEQIRTTFAKAGEEFGKIDFVLHSIAFADRNDLAGDTVDTSREGFKLAMDVSVYTLLACTAAAKPYMAPGGGDCNHDVLRRRKVCPRLQRDGYLQSGTGSRRTIPCL